MKSTTLSPQQLSGAEETAALRTPLKCHDTSKSGDDRREKHLRVKMPGPVWNLPLLSVAGHICKMSLGGEVGREAFFVHFGRKTKWLPTKLTHQQQKGEDNGVREHESPC